VVFQRQAEAGALEAVVAKPKPEPEAGSTPLPLAA
jgi:hypothetical protein